MLLIYFILKKEIAIDCTKSWYNEGTNYDYSNPSLSAITTHFTQLVWKSSNKVGLGLSVSKFNGQFNAIYCVAHYYIGGNVPNAFRENVLASIYK